MNRNNQSNESIEDLTSAKPLLLEALGQTFLTWLLAAADEQLDRWRADEEGALSSSQHRALVVLWNVLRGTSENNAELQPWNLSRILGQYNEQFGTTVVNIVRTIARGDEPPARAIGETVKEVLGCFVREVYGLYLLPYTSDSDHALSRPVLFQHPLREKFERLVLEDSALRRLFSENDPSSGWRGNVFRSTGQGGTVQLWSFAELLIESGWKAAQIDSATPPTLDEHIEKTLVQLETVQASLAGKEVNVPVRIGLTGVLLPPGTVLDLGWGRLRCVEEKDGHLVPKHIKGELQGSHPDGTTITINYAGDVALDTSIKYRTQLRDVELSKEWPKGLRGHEEIESMVESARLGALLSQNEREELPTVLRTWQYIHDPLAHGHFSGCNDPRTNRPFMPKQLSDEDANTWREFTIKIQRERNKRIEVAIRRTLRAAAERQDFTDVLVDSVIAWENLVGSQRGEPTLRVSGALAWLLEENIEARIERRAELTHLYGLRSKVVHGSDKSPEGREVVEKSQRALKLTVAALCKLFTTRLDLLKDCKNSDERSNRLLMGG